MEGGLMKKTKLLNAPISWAVAQLGHGNSICIGDAGLPVPDGINKIDLAVSSGVPRFLDVFDAITSEMFVESAIIGVELQDSHSQFHTKLLEAIRVLETSQKNKILVEAISHENLKTKTQSCMAVVRTGECTPFANIILFAGVPF
jgi:D-ribose pyranase